MAPSRRFPIETYSFLLLLHCYVRRWVTIRFGLQLLTPKYHLSQHLLLIIFQVLAILLMKTNNRSLHVLTTVRHYWICHPFCQLHIHVWNILHHFLLQTNISHFVVLHLYLTNLEINVSVLLQVDLCIWNSRTSCSTSKHFIFMMIF